MAPKPIAITSGMARAALAPSAGSSTGSVLPSASAPSRCSNCPSAMTIAEAEMKPEITE